MLDLPGVTLCCIDTANHALSVRALMRSRAGVRFGRTLLLTDALPASVDVDGIDVVGIARLDSRTAYSELVLKALGAHVATPHVLIVQWDGYVINPDAWDPEFLACDYVGARWFWFEDGHTVGNGGFSLRSRKLLDALLDPRIALVENEDTTIGRTFRTLLERDHGIRFASDALADRFAFEAAYPIGRPFGFHGLFNFCRTVAEDELARLAPAFSDAIARSPQLLQLLRNSIALGQWHAARAIGVRMLAADPDQREVRTLLLTATTEAERPRLAGRNEPCPCGSGRKFKQCHGSLDGQPRDTTARRADATADDLVRAAMAAHQNGALETAMRDYRAALALAPGHPTASHFLGVVLYQRGDLDQAIPLLASSAEAVPEEPEFHNNHGLALAAADRNDEAIAAYRRALLRRPDHAIAFNNLGLALVAANRLPDAIAAYRRALAIAPSFLQCRWNLALALLVNGEFAQGWREYESRLAIAQLGGTGPRFSCPRWDGQARPGETLLLSTEQGLGDAIQFARFASAIAGTGMRVVIAAPRAALRLLATVPGVSAVVAIDDPPPPADAHLPLLSTAGILGIDPSTMPDRVPYLRADATRRTRIAAELAPVAGKRRIGLAWHGSPRYPNNRRRSAPLAALAPLFALRDTVWVSLQIADGEEEIAGVPAAGTLVQLDARRDLDDTAALIAELDLVVCVDTSLGHLAGAMARPTFVLLPFAPDWRWQLTRADSPWYPGVRLFRQPRPGDWDAVVRELIDALS